MMLQEAMRDPILRKLRQIEAEYGVKVLLAVESGSRAWGFASPDSDFDVRFIYARPRDCYLRLQGGRDVIETPIDGVWDVNGWDLDKALRLLRKSNPTLFEWINSPIIYRDAGFRQRVRPLMEACFSKRTALNHYLSMARNNLRRHLGGETIRPKKYFYILRPVLACRWIMARGCPPPVLFSELSAAELPPALRPGVERLLDLKVNGPEKLEIAHLPELDAYLETSLAEIEAHIRSLPRAAGPRWDPLNAFFLEELNRL